MTFTAAEIQAAIEKIELLADQDRSASYAPILARLDAEARIARRAAAPIRRADPPRTDPPTTPLSA